MNNRFDIETLGVPEFPNSLAHEEHCINGVRVLYKIRIPDQEISAQQIDEHEDSFEKSGPQAKLYFNPKRTKAAIVTCGGLCPGMNAVVHGVVKQLYNRYRVENIVGIKYGYQGLSQEGESFMELTPGNTEDIQHEGGTILGTSRGAPEMEQMVNCLERNNINILFAVGGGGTMSGAHAISQEIKKRGLKISVIGIPKTIDNDIPYVNRSFGFETAVEKASEVVLAGHEEARGHYNGIGLVKLMGRNAGFIAAGTVMATGVVNLCLIPEINFSIHGNDGLIVSIKKRFKEKKHTLIVVAEGVGLNLIKPDLNQRDLSGNLILPDIGIFLRDKISQELKKEKIAFSLKYLDPSYFIRSSGPNSFDKVFCSRLAQNAVHAAMAGKTDMLVGYWHGEMTYVPLSVLKGKLKKINPKGTYWFNVMDSTSQMIGRD